MDLNVNMTLNLSEKDVSAIIRDYIESQGYALTGKVNFIVSNRIEGFGMMEHNVTHFDGVNVSVTK